DGGRERSRRRARCVFSSDEETHEMALAVADEDVRALTEARGAGHPRDAPRLPRSRAVARGDDHWGGLAPPERPSRSKRAAPFPARTPCPPCAPRLLATCCSSRIRQRHARDRPSRSCFASSPAAAARSSHEEEASTTRDRRHAVPL